MKYFQPGCSSAMWANTPEARKLRLARPSHPREPLYTLTEIADRLGTTMLHVRALMASHPGLKAWHAKGSVARSNLYRLSDAKRWWASLPEDKRK